MKTVIIEDNLSQVRELIDMLASHSDKTQVVGVASTIQDAKTLLSEKTPDLVFLDVIINKTNALTELKPFFSANSQIIVTTGYDGYAISAFEINATSFLLKPFERVQLANAIDLAQQNFNRQLPNRLQQIVVKSTNSWQIIELNTIVHIEASKGYTNIHLNNRKLVMVSKNIGEVNEQIREDMGFIRVHKSHIINIKYVLEVQTGRQCTILLPDQTEIPLAQRRKDAFFDLLSRLPTL